MPKSLGKFQAVAAKLAANNLLIFILLLGCGCTLGAYLCNANRWDFANYHYYNAFAFLHDRLNYDIVPASINTFFNPLIELPLYFFISHFNDDVRLIFVLQGVWAGLLLFTLYKIYALFFDTTKIVDLLWLILVLCVAATSQATLFQIGSSTNEIPVAFMILWGLYILLKMIKLPDTQNLWKFLTAGLIMGVALGLKQTVVVYCISAGLMLICCFPYFKKPYKSIIIFALGGLLGFLIVNGWWMWKMWVLYDNPVFPFLNGVFKSEYFDEFNFRDKRFLPDLKTFLIYPYLWYFFPNGISEVSYEDIRLTLIYTILCGVLICCLWRHEIKEKYQKRHFETALYLYVFISFIIWMLLFSILRYAIIIEVLGAFFLVMTFKYFMPSNNVCRIFYITFFVILGWIIIQNMQGWNNLQGSKRFVYVEPVKFPPNTLLKLYNFPTAGVVPEWAKNNQFRAVGYMHLNCQLMQGADFVERGKFCQIRDDIVKNHTGPVVIVYDDGIGNNLKNFEEYASSRAKCENFRQTGALSASWNCAAGRCPTWPRLEAALSRELSNGYFCRPLKNNLRNTLKICVPQELKTQILGEE